MGVGSGAIFRAVASRTPLEALVCTLQVSPSKEYFWHQGWNLPTSRFSWRRGLTYSQVKTWAYTQLPRLRSAELAPGAPAQRGRPVNSERSSLWSISSSRVTPTETAPSPDSSNKGPRQTSVCFSLRHFMDDFTGCQSHGDRNGSHF